jgi:hypothetical protein
VAVLALASLGLLVGIAGGVRSWLRDRQGFPMRLALDQPPKG